MKDLNKKILILEEELHTWEKSYNNWIETEKLNKKLMAAIG
jgi:hypothetical protein